jgi:tetratricopeptide (TPR) repeat protein
LRTFAGRFLERALTIRPNWSELYVTRAELCLRGGDPRAALQHARKAVEVRRVFKQKKSEKKYKE